MNSIACPGEGQEELTSRSPGLFANRFQLEHMYIALPSYATDACAFMNILDNATIEATDVMSTGSRQRGRTQGTKDR